MGLVRIWKRENRKRSERVSGRQHLIAFEEVVALKGSTTLGKRLALEKVTAFEAMGSLGETDCGIDCGTHSAALVCRLSCR